jgi:uncharacterized protein YdhG (YjbR/CyaY superfamily)
MQAYNLGAKTLLFFQDGEKFKSRYCTLGFTDLANLDKDEMWATSYAITSWNADVEKIISTLVKKAVKAKK